MILDKGICSVFRATDGAESGDMPLPVLTLLYQSWYGEINFETSPQYPTEGRKELKTDQRVRVMQNRAIREHDVAVLMDVTKETDIPAGTPFLCERFFPTPTFSRKAVVHEQFWHQLQQQGQRRRRL